MWWKIYFWALTILLVGGIIFVYGEIRVWYLGDWVDIIVGLLGIIGLYSFVYKKPFFTKRFWSGVFIAQIILVVEAFLYFTPFRGVNFLPRYNALYDEPMLGSMLLFFVFTSIPYYWAQYQISDLPSHFSGKKKKK